METLIPFLYLLVGIAVSLFVWAVVSMSKLGREKEELPDELNSDDVDGESLAADLGDGMDIPRLSFVSAPLFIVVLLPMVKTPARLIYDWIGTRLRTKSAEEDLILRCREMIHQMIISAGSPGAIIVEELICASILGGCLLTALMAMLAVVAEYNVLVTALSFGTLAAVLPFLWLVDAMKKRQIAIRKALPYMLDLLTLCVEAGMDFTTAVGRLVPRLAGTPLGFELGQLLQEIKIGRSRTESLKALGKRINLVEFSTVVSAIVQAEQLGTSLGFILRIQAEEARRRRSLRAEELAMKAPTKMTLPLVLFIFPVTLLILFAPIFIKHLPTFSNL